MSQDHRNTKVKISQDDYMQHAVSEFTELVLNDNKICRS